MFAYVQVSADVNNNQATVDLTLSATVVDNLVVITSVSNPKGETLDSVTDDKGNVYVVLPVVENAYGQVNQAYGMQLIGGVTTVTLHFSNPTDHRCFANEFSGFMPGVKNANVYDDTETGFGAMTGTVATATLVPDAKGELIVESMGIDTTLSWGAGSGYTLCGPHVSLSINAQYKLFGTLAEGGGASAS